MPRCLEMKPKIVRKKRSDVYCISSDLGKPIISLPKAAPSTLEEEGAASSCLSSTSSTMARSRSGDRSSISKLKSSRVRQGKQSTATTGSMSMRRQEIAILKMLSGGCCFSEVRIRELLGNSPDTSKALRMLLKREKIRRSGKGGRPDPYVYRIA